ncbi:MAG: SpoIIE family protein phosphatase [Candidatus Baltobacteraceae bacterium]
MDLTLLPSNSDELVALLDLLPTPSVIALNPECTSVRMNRAFTDLIGFPREDEAHACKAGVWTRPYTYKRNGRELESGELPIRIAVATGRELRNAELELHMDDGRVFHLVGSAAPLRDARGTITGSVATFMDVTEHHVLQRKNEALGARLNYLAETGQELSESLDMRAVLDTLTRIMVPRFADCVSISLMDEDGSTSMFHVFHRDREVLSKLIETRARLKQTGPSSFLITERVRKSGQGEVIDDLHSVAADPSADAHYREYVRELSERFDLKKAVVVPMKNRGVFGGILMAIGGSERLYTQEDLRLLEELGRRAASAIENARSYERQRRLAETLQEALLPAHLPKVEELQFDAVYAPGDDEASVGGDWYDAFELPDGRIAVSIGDVTGRGIHAAVVMSKMRHAIKALTLYESDPKKLLDAADTVLRSSHSEAIVTALVGVLDAGAGTLTYATAGHPPPYLRRAGGGVVQLPCNGLPLGLRTEKEQAPVTVQLCRSDIILFYTDGLLESTHDLSEGERRIINALTELAPETYREAAHFIRATVLHDGSRDDVALLTIRILSACNDCSPDTLQWSFDSEDAVLAHDSRKLLLSHLLQLGAPGDDYSSAELVFGELIGNVVRHTAGRVTVRLDWSGNYPELTVLDSGAGFDFETHLPKDMLSEAGRGLFLVNALTREFDVKKAPQGGTLARAVLQLERAK